MYVLRVSGAYNQEAQTKCLPNRTACLWASSSCSKDQTGGLCDRNQIPTPSCVRTPGLMTPVLNCSKWACHWAVTWGRSKCLAEVSGRLHLLLVCYLHSLSLYHRRKLNWPQLDLLLAATWALPTLADYTLIAWWFALAPSPEAQLSSWGYEECGHLFCFLRDGQPHGCKLWRFRGNTPSLQMLTIIAASFPGTAGNSLCPFNWTSRVPVGLISGSFLQRMVWSISSIVAPTTSCGVERGLRG